MSTGPITGWARSCMSFVQAQPSQNSQKWMQRCCTLMTSMFMLNASGKVLRLPLKLYVIKHYWGCQKWRHQNWQDCCNENDAEIEQLTIEKLSWQCDVRNTIRNTSTTKWDSKFSAGFVRYNPSQGLDWHSRQMNETPPPRWTVMQLRICLNSQ